MGHEIDDCIPETNHLLKIDRQIHEVIESGKAVIFKSLQHCHLCEIFGQVSEHNSCA